MSLPLTISQWKRDRTQKPRNNIGRKWEKTIEKKNFVKSLKGGIVKIDLTGKQKWKQDYSREVNARL